MAYQALLVIWYRSYTRTLTVIVNFNPYQGNNIYIYILYIEWLTKVYIYIYIYIYFRESLCVWAHAFRSSRKSIDIKVEFTQTDMPTK